MPQNNLWEIGCFGRETELNPAQNTFISPLFLLRHVELSTHKTGPFVFLFLFLLLFHTRTHTPKSLFVLTCRILHLRYLYFSVGKRGGFGLVWMGGRGGVAIARKWGFFSTPLCGRFGGRGVKSEKGGVEGGDSRLIVSLPLSLPHRQTALL